ELKVEVPAADSEARERRVRSSVEQTEAERQIEGHGVAHVPRQQRDGADALDGLALRFHACQPCRKLEGPAASSKCAQFAPLSGASGDHWRRRPLCILIY